ncbi:hypothetical protein PsYK624_025660 [Phanerochaete sordida]|uniref:Uncharacterized protein n=1 Tax=Phanerochaete sordida TaxID=48140 RepID=A0A9P3L8U2_9APHY|nr:hypothetical protein PsYK624_025660 [Phanerochaete sordida]
MIRHAPHNAPTFDLTTSIKLIYSPMLQMPCILGDVTSGAAAKHWSSSSVSIATMTASLTSSDDHLRIGAPVRTLSTLQAVR